MTIKRKVINSKFNAEYFTIADVYLFIIYYWATVIIIGLKTISRFKISILKKITEHKTVQNDSH
ncbi:MAG: hypothetical protein ACEY3J_04690 [Arsenophonus sp.]